MDKSQLAPVYLFLGWKKISSSRVFIKGTASRDFLFFVLFHEFNPSVSLINILKDF